MLSKKYVNFGQKSQLQMQSQKMKQAGAFKIPDQFKKEKRLIKGQHMMFERIQHRVVKNNENPVLIPQKPLDSSSEEELEIHMSSGKP